VLLAWGIVREVGVGLKAFVVCRVVLADARECKTEKPGINGNNEFADHLTLVGRQSADRKVRVAMRRKVLRTEVSAAKESAAQPIWSSHSETSQIQEVAPPIRRFIFARYIRTEPRGSPPIIQCRIGRSQKHLQQL